MFAELVYDERNFDGLPGTKDIILGELTKRVHRISPGVDVRARPMMTLPEINTDANKCEREQISRTIQEMFEQTDMQMVPDQTPQTSTINRDWQSFSCSHYRRLTNQL